MIGITKALSALRQVLTPIWGARPVRSARAMSYPPIVREPYPGAWQRNEEIAVDSAVAYGAVYACTTRIASDIGKLRLRLVAQDADGIWTETSNPAFSPVLRRPNRYQNIIKFVEQWIVSKLLHGNTYVLKERDQRGVVKALCILDPSRVTPLVTPAGEVYYQLDRDELAGIVSPTGAVTVPASEIIHDLMVALFHPLCGVSPIFACGLSALQGLKIQNNSTNFFANGAHPGSLLIAPGDLDPQDAADMKAMWETAFTGQNAGRVALLSGGVKFEPLKISAVDAQLIEQLKWTAETVCSCFHVPPTMISVGPYPPYANSEPILQQYYSQCLQTFIVSLEKCLDEGLELPPPYGTEFDIDDLIWMDTATRSKAASDAIGAGAMSPDEARKKYYGLGPVPGGDTPYMQQQYYALSALAARDADDPFAKPAPPPAPAPEDDDDDPDLALDAVTASAGALLQKAWAA